MGKRNARLLSQSDVSKYLARLINRVDHDEIDPAKASKIGYLVNILKSTLELGELERRVEALESKESEGELWQKVD